MGSRSRTSPRSPSPKRRPPSCANGSGTHWWRPPATTGPPPHPGEPARQATGTDLRERPGLPAAPEAGSTAIALPSINSTARQYPPSTRSPRGCSSSIRSRQACLRASRSSTRSSRRSTSTSGGMPSSSNFSTTRAWHPRSWARTCSASTSLDSAGSLCSSSRTGTWFSSAPL